MNKLLLVIPVSLFSLSVLPCDFPIAKNLARGEYKFDIRFYNDGGLLFSIDAAILDKLSIGLRYGGTGIIGYGKVRFNPAPGVSISYLILEELEYWPSAILGIETQGFDHYIEDNERYFIKSRGLYLCISKEFPVLSGFILNGGLNRTFETKDEKSGFDIFSSLILNFSPEFSFFLEYALGYNDPLHTKGILNSGVSFNLINQFFFTFSFRDLLSDTYMRTFQVGYKGHL
ncbi:MAG: hypothetical protein ABDH49_03045 [Candidatus Hydrothermales bacterium]